jgi:hypothetical protein
LNGCGIAKSKHRGQDMKSSFAALLFLLGVISSDFASAASKDYIVTKGPAGIWSLAVTASGTSVVKGPFVPYPVPLNNPDPDPDPAMLAASPNGEFLFALYGAEFGPFQLYSFQMINGTPVQVSLVDDGQINYSDGGFLRAMTASANYVFVATTFTDTTHPAGILWVFRTTNGVLKLVGSYLLPTVADPLSIQIDAGEHFVYINYANQTDSTVANETAIYDIDIFPPTLVRGVQPQEGGWLIGVQ